MKSSGAENVVIPTGNSALGAKAMVALDAVGFDPLVTGISGLQGYNFTELAGDPAEGVTFVRAPFRAASSRCWPSGGR